MKERFIITVDGPAGAGKTTISKILADRLAYKYVDTGALYRGIAFAVQTKKISPENDHDLENLCSSLVMQFIQSAKGLRLLLNRSDITEKIRTPEISMLASAVSARPVVRSYLLSTQRAMGREKGVVFEGRDMGTVVFPEADVKFFLYASVKTRALRRYQELSSKTSQTLAEVEKDMNRRDKNDISRSIAPLKPAQDAIKIDSTHISINDVVALMLGYIDGVGSVGIYT